MSRKGHFDLIKQELEILEKGAQQDSKLEPPIVDDSFCFEGIVQAIFSDDPKYWIMEKKSNRRLLYDHPQYIANLKTLRLRQKKRNEKREERTVRNQQNYFERANESVLLVEIGLDYERKGHIKDAITSFKMALKDAPNDSRQLYSSLCFNLGKAYFESGDTKLGLYYLTKYCSLQSEGDYYKSILNQLFQLRYKSVTINGKTFNVLKTGKLNGKEFKVTKSKVNFAKSLSNRTQSKLELEYKIPYSLELEFKDKEEITMLDYQYLIQFNRSSSKSYFYELVLPLNKFSVFMEEFYGTLIEYGIQIQPLNDLDTLYTELFVLQKLQNSLKYYEPQELELLQAFKSVILIEVPSSKRDSLIDDYKRFLSLYVLEQKTDEELDQVEVEKIKENFEHEQYIGLMQNYRDYQADYEHHLKVKDEYARLCVYLYNLEHGIPAPLKTENLEIYNKAQTYYWSLLGSAFSIYEKNSSEKNEEGVFSELAFQNQLLKKGILIQWDVIHEILTIDPYSALQKIRILIEAIINEVFNVKGYSFLGKNGIELNLKEKCDRINWALNQDIRKKLDKLRFKGNFGSHYIDIKENYFSYLEPVTKEQVVQYLCYLKEVITYLVKRFSL
ncbi:hypothetical protein [Priestia aryabhattai]|uniref:hypothetical protein n=1 Tax=Priestia aryabhattai TaxID=412384 RepID=UPI00203D9DEB|nr:hypothetical protein [Priestia aryabhattai]MCM3255580.1 hypothetical protein [Priestia aryabhattai]